MHFFPSRLKGLCRRGHRKILELTGTMTHAHDLHKTKWNKIQEGSKGSGLKSSNHSEESVAIYSRLKMKTNFSSI